MHVFLTGASGFIGSRILTELLNAGHQVTGLARSDSSAGALRLAGAEVWRGTLEEPASFTDAVERADAVIHTAFDHDFHHFVESCEKDRRVIQAMGEVLKGSARPLLITSGTGMGDDGPMQPAETEQRLHDHANPRIATEREANALLAADVNVRLVCLPQVHDTTRQGLITWYIQHALEKGAVACIGDGDNRWSAAHVSDVARLYRLVLEQGEGGHRYHAVAEEAVLMREIAQTVAGKLNLPQLSLSTGEAQAHFGWFAIFAGMSLRSSSVWTRRQLNWQPVGPGLLEDLRAMDYQNVFARP